ncbi:hypothetical protein CYY_008852 [Polysphondylium violaceum]|uniref:EF-hand domain-containing protein n=1 Tax=Polysphondylium violaceum TaxID=133409 RepID=A0A8J4PMU6_9MYCE|nr:hypothetical protein CYY_008852 [Polysphondylium violaceum]
MTLSVVPGEPEANSVAVGIQELDSDSDISGDIDAITSLIETSLILEDSEDEEKVSTSSVGDGRGDDKDNRSITTTQSSSILDNIELKHAIKSLTGVFVSDDFISILKKHIALSGDTEIDFEEFREAFSQITRSLYPGGVPNAHSESISNPPSPPPSPTRSRSHSCSSSSAIDLLSPPNSPRNSDSSSPFSFSPVSSSPPKYITYLSTSPSSSHSPPLGNNSNNHHFVSNTTNIFSKPPPISPRRIGNRPRSSSLKTNHVQPSLEQLNDDQNPTLLNSKPISTTAVTVTPSSSIVTSKKPPIVYSSSTGSNGSFSATSSFLNHQIVHQASPSQSHFNQNDLFKSLLALDEPSTKQNKSKSKPISTTNHHHKSNMYNISPNSSSGQLSPQSEDGDHNQNIFMMEELNNMLVQKSTAIKPKEKEKKKKYTYRIDNEEEEISWATEEFYYDPTLTNLDDLHSIISILKEKYSISKSKSNELEKRLQIAIKVNTELEDELDALKKDYIALSLSNQAIRKNNQNLEQSLEFYSSNTNQLRIGCMNLEKENQSLKKKISSFEDTISNNQKLIESTQKEIEYKEIKYQNEIQHLNHQYSFNIQSVKKEYQKEFENEYKKNKECIVSLEKKKSIIELENTKLRELLEISNEKLDNLEKSYQEKTKEYIIQMEEKQNQNVSQEILSTENQKLLNQLNNLKKQWKKIELQKIIDLKNEIKRTKQEHQHYKSLLLQGINDFKSMENTILTNLHPPNHSSLIAGGGGNSNSNSSGIGNITTNTIEATITTTTTTTTTNLNLNLQSLETPTILLSSPHPSHSSRNRIKDIDPATTTSNSDSLVLKKKLSSNKVKKDPS